MGIQWLFWNLPAAYLLLFGFWLLFFDSIPLVSFLSFIVLMILLLYERFAIVL